MWLNRGLVYDTKKMFELVCGTVFFVFSKMRRQYTTKSGQVKTYEYKRNTKTNAQLKREHLLKFIEDHKEQLDEFGTKNDKINYILDNIDTYKYGYTTIYRHLK